MKQTFDRACASLLLFMAFQTAVTLTFSLSRKEAENHQSFSRSSWNTHMSNTESIAQTV